MVARISQLDVTQRALAYQVADYTNVPKSLIDICFDGQHFYALSSQSVWQLLPDVSAKTMRQIRSWNHGLTGARGITFDGDNLIITTT